MKGGDTVKAMKKRKFYLEFQLSVAVINTMSDRIHRRGMGFSDLQVVGLRKGSQGRNLDGRTGAEAREMLLTHLFGCTTQPAAQEWHRLQWVEPSHNN